MNSFDKNKFVYSLAQEYLKEMVSKHLELTPEILKQHFEQESKFDTLNDACERLVVSLTNKQMMPNVIGLKEKKEKMKEILFSYDPSIILANYHDSSELFETFKLTFSLQNADRERSLWKSFASGIISGCMFLATFRDKEDFDQFIKTFTLNSFTKGALPMLLEKEIHGFGFALACDFLKELGYRDYPKPDVHLITIFHELGLSASKEPYEVYKAIIKMAELVGEDAYTVDKTFWFISSGNFYLVNLRVTGKRDEFIKYAKIKLIQEELNR